MGRTTKITGLIKTQSFPSNKQINKIAQNRATPNESLLHNAFHLPLNRHILGDPIFLYGLQFCGSISCVAALSQGCAAVLSGAEKSGLPTYSMHHPGAVLLSTRKPFNLQQSACDQSPGHSVTAERPIPHRLERELLTGPRQPLQWIL